MNLMKNKILSYLLGWLFVALLGFWWLWWNYVDAANCGWDCNWVKLNTCFPVIWDCIESGEATGAFPRLMSVLTKVVISLTLVVCFILIIVGWIMRAADKPKEWKALIVKVAITLLLLWFSWVILRLVNPNFFA